MTTAVKKEDNLIQVKQYITDEKGRKVAAIIDIEELNRVGEVLKNIPSSEVWLYQNSEAFAGVQRGLKEVSEGKISKLNINDL